MQLIDRFHRVTARLVKDDPATFTAAGPMMSVSFDDAPRSAVVTGGPIVEAHGGRATFYVAGDFCGKTVDGHAYFTADDLVAAQSAGHEIGCHTFDHRHATQMPIAAFEDDCARNRDFLAATLGGGPRSFAYPFGDVSLKVKRAARARYATCRGIRPGVNRSPLDLALLKAMPLESRSWTPGAMERLARAAARSKAWLILFSHDVGDQPSPYGCTPADLVQALEIGRRHGLEILTVGAAAERLLANP